jgi:hypothetical protein
LCSTTARCFVLRTTLRVLKTNELTKYRPRRSVEPREACCGSIDYTVGKITPEVRPRSSADILPWPAMTSASATARQRMMFPMPSWAGAAISATSFAFTAKSRSRPRVQQLPPQHTSRQPLFQSVNSVGTAVTGRALNPDPEIRESSSSSSSCSSSIYWDAPMKEPIFLAIILFRLCDGENSRGRRRAT